MSAAADPSGVDPAGADPAGAAPPATGWLSEESLKRLVLVLIAGISVLTAVVGLLQNDYGAQGARYRRDANIYALRAMGMRSSGSARIGYDWFDAYATRSQVDLQARAGAEWEDEGATYRYEEVRDRLTTLSPLLAPPYFTPGGTEPPNVRKYEADTYLVQSTALSERFLRAAILDDVWDTKANTFITHLTLLAVALALLGLCVVVAGRARYIFLVTAVLMVGVSCVWIVQVIGQPVPNLSDEAIDRYALGVGLAHQGDDAGAVTAFDAALAATPGYGVALYERGRAQSRLGNYDAAVASLQEARAAGKDDARGAALLGWTFYLAGKFDDSARELRRSLALDPNQFLVRARLGLTLLASGQVDTARAEYGAAMDLVSRQVAEVRASGQEPPSTLWTNMGDASTDLEGLSDRLSQPKSWTLAPSKEKISQDSNVPTAARDLLVQVRNLAIALEYTGKPPQGTATAKASPFEFEALDPNTGEYTIAASFPAGAKELWFAYSYEGFVDGKDTVLKFYRNGIEETGLRYVYAWEEGAAGETDDVLTSAYGFKSGTYTLEMYFDSRLVQSGTFVVDPAAP